VESHLYKTLLKSKNIHESGFLPEYVRIGTKASQDSQEEITAVSNVTARLYNTKQVKEAMSHIMGAIYGILGIDNPYATRTHKITENDPPVMEGDERIKLAEYGTDEGLDNPDSPSPDQPPGLLDVSMDLAGSNSNPNSDSDPEMNDGYDSDGNQNALLVASSDEEPDISVREDTAIGQSTTVLGTQGKLKDTSASLSGSLRSPSPPLNPKKSTKKAQQGPPKTGSTFLPTLMGGYWSGSESATDDEELSTRKKNRPGQQARRALWEKKFGTEANHLKGQSSGKSRDQDWDPRRGARGAEDRRFTRGRATRRGGLAVSAKCRERSSGENTAAVKPRARGMGKKDDTGPLHPSWEAAKKAKESKQTASFQGKKVVFE
jgi:hypothetical protein